MAPQASRPASDSRPGLSTSIVTVTSAITQAPAASPVCADRPLGTSAETTRAPELLTVSIQTPKGARTSPRNPVPSIASITTSDWAKSASS